jgi:hypothetical protein
MSQPFDNRDYDVMKLNEKDAEIELLKAKVEAARVELRQQWDRMKKENLALKDRVTEKDALITELADALEQQSCWSTKVELIQRAREATK